MTHLTRLPIFLRRLTTVLSSSLAGALFLYASVAFAQAPPPPDEPLEDGETVEVTATYDYDYGLDTDPSAIDDFREPLSPYGSWIDHPTYGTVWVPSAVVVGRDFSPYRTHGRWAVTDDDQWVWVSDFDWGYIPFHYGRWAYVNTSGWVWVPGRVYAPAWVTWRVGTPGFAYVGWAPAPPSYVWFGGRAVGFYATVGVPWWYCPSAYVFSPGWSTHVVVNRSRVRRIHRRTRSYNRFHGRTYRRGPARGVARRGPSSGVATPRRGPSSGTATRRGPSSGKASRRAPAAGNASAQRVGVPRSPSFKDAGVPPRAVPRQRVARSKRKALS
ncbi:MAG: DUF6600 domain-containing protein, partial [Myxococcota bacterium]